jgi:6,7-dimethyl-8-ribityllumazine synthase
MSSAHKHLDQLRPEGLEPVEGKTIGLVVAEWNEEITFAMRDAAVVFLKDHGVSASEIKLMHVPGSFELVFGATQLLETGVDGVIVIGCVIQGETPHFTFISQAVASGIADLNIRYARPVIFGVLTTLNQEQAKERSGGRHGNKGTEAAATLIKVFNACK